jgi:hypothetical protein
MSRLLYLAFVISIFYVEIALPFGLIPARTDARPPSHSLTMIIRREKGSKSTNRIVYEKRRVEYKLDSRGGKPKTIRQARISRALQSELADIISSVDIKAISYPDEYLLASTSVMDVDISPDLRVAKVC